MPPDERNDGKKMTRRWGPRLLLSLLALLAACAGLPAYLPAPPEHAFTDVSDTRLGRICAASLSSVPPALSGFRMLPEGNTAFNARVALAKRAERSLDVQYYLIAHDDLGLQFLRELRDAAARGVRVRLLLDDLYTSGEDGLLSGLAAYPNVEVRLFNPLPVRAGSFRQRLLFSMLDFGRINHRMHNKLFIADDSFAVSGGRNIGEEYFMGSLTANFIDLDVLSSGPVVNELSTVFDTYWNSKHVMPIGRLVEQGSAAEARRRFDDLVRDTAPEVPERARDVLGTTPVAQQLDSGELTQAFASARVFADTPAKAAGADRGAAGPTVTDQTLALFATARAEVAIASPYFIPGEAGMAIIRAVGATQENGRLTLLTNSLGSTDEALAYAGYARYRLELLKAGVRIYELGGVLSRSSLRLGDFSKSLSRLHAKVATIDRRTVFIGSMNLDPRSSRLNTEIGLAIDSSELAQTVAGLSQAVLSGAFRLQLAADGEHIEWLQTDTQGRQIVLTREPDDNWWLRLKMWLLTPFVAEGLL